MGAVVTASGTGTEINGGAVITHEEKLWKGPISGTTATFAVLDPGAIPCPYRLYRYSPVLSIH